MLITLLKIVLFGLVEGISEWLPISSTGHIILLNEWITLPVRPEFWSIFLVVIQLGAILAVVFIYFHRLNPFSPKKTRAERRTTWQTWFKVAVGCVPAAVFGFLLDDILDAYLSTWWIVAFTLIFYGVWFIHVENKNAERVPAVTAMDDLSYTKAFQIGLFQTLSLIPGTSRSGASILGGLLLGTSRPVAADFSFFMSIPIMFGASGLRVVKAVFLDDFRFSGEEWLILLLGSFVAFLVSIVTIKFLLRFIQTNDFKPFGWYRIALGIVVILFFARNVIAPLALVLAAALAVIAVVLYAVQRD